MIKCIVPDEPGYAYSWSLTDHSGRFISVLHSDECYTIGGIWVIDLLNLKYLHNMIQLKRIRSNTSKDLEILVNITITGLILL